MNRHDIDWHGYIPAITTPFTRSGEFDWNALEKQLEWLVNEKMHGVVLAGTTGEWFSMEPQERVELFNRASQLLVGTGLTVLGGCNSYTAKEAIYYANAAKKAKLDGILLTPPPYVVPSHAELLEFYRDVSTAVEIPMCVYNWPRGCIVDMDTQLLKELAKLPTVVAIKNSTGNFAAFLQGLYALSEQVRYFGIPTSELGADLVTAGRGDGLMGAAGVLGSDHPDFWRALKDGDRERAITLGQRDRILMEDWFRPDYGAKFGSAQAILKAALRLRGVPAGYVRKPLLELNAEELSLVKQTLHRLKIETVE